MKFLVQVFARDKNGNPGENETLIYESGAEDVSDISVSNKTEDSLYLSWHSSEDSLTCTEYYTVSWCVDEKQEWPATSSMLYALCSMLYANVQCLPHAHKNKNRSTIPFFVHGKITNFKLLIQYSGSINFAGRRKEMQSLNL
uniref:Uncharacterized protein n=1 Tax=Timema shepardi TaxID=629360 RepID=A0A7R9BAI8_TIMSH|nr:unnamed protein product [Timema shepardi]